MNLSEFPLVFFAIGAIYMDNSIRFNRDVTVPLELMPKVSEVEILLGQVTGKRLIDVNPLIRKMVGDNLAGTGVEIDNDTLLLPWVINPVDNSDIIVLSAVGLTVAQITTVKSFLEQNLKGKLAKVWMKE